MTFSKISDFFRIVYLADFFQSSSLRNFVDHCFFVWVCMNVSPVFIPYLCLWCAWCTPYVGLSCPSKLVYLYICLSSICVQFWVCESVCACACVWLCSLPVGLQTKASSQWENRLVYWRPVRLRLNLLPTDNVYHSTEGNVSRKRWNQRGRDGNKRREGGGKADPKPGRAFWPTSHYSS